MRVEWKEEALDRLADLFVTSSLGDQGALEVEVLGINAALARSPLDLGESRAGLDRRIWYTARLVLVFRVYAPEGLVVVSDVKLGRRPV